MLPKWFPGLPEPDKEEFIALKQKFDEFGWMLMAFTPYVRILRKEALPQLPLRGNISSEEKMPGKVLDATAYREFHEACVAYGVPAIEQFRAIRDRNKA